MSDEKKYILKSHGSVQIDPETGETRLALHPRMPSPPQVFYADWIEAERVHGGVKLIAYAVGPAGSEAKAIQLAFAEEYFGILVQSVREISDAVLKYAPINPGRPEFENVSVVGSFLATAGYVAVAQGGVSIDVYQLSPLDTHRIAKGIHDLVEFRPVIRIEALPGRLNWMLDWSDE